MNPLSIARNMYLIHGQQSKIHMPHRERSLFTVITSLRTATREIHTMQSKIKFKSNLERKKIITVFANLSLIDFSNFYM